MADRSAPDFEQWVEFCFTTGPADFADHSGDSDDVVCEREAYFCELPPIVIANYLTRLFESPSFLIDRYTDDQIADATWFIFGTATEYIHEVRSNVVPEAAQIRCMHSVKTLYRDLYDRICGRRGTDPDADLRETCKIDCAVYMIWDMGSLGTAALFPKQFPHLVQPSLDVLDTILHESRTSACRVSVLHGIGHLLCGTMTAGRRQYRRRLRDSIDRFLQREDLPRWLREYALDARDGAVQ